MDDFAPRYEYPESMTQLERICAMARAAGMTYGQYIQKHGAEIAKPKKKNHDLRQCKQCGELFMPRVLKDGRLSPRQTSCEKCIEKNKNKTPRPSGKKYKAHCSWCKKEIEMRRPAGKNGNLWCDECRKANRYGALRLALRERVQA